RNYHRLSFGRIYTEDASEPILEPGVVYHIAAFYHTNLNGAGLRSIYLNGASVGGGFGPGLTMAFKNEGHPFHVGLLDGVVDNVALYLGLNESAFNALAASHYAARTRDPDSYRDVILA